MSQVDVVQPNRIHRLRAILRVCLLVELGLALVVSSSAAQEAPDICEQLEACTKAKDPWAPIAVLGVGFSVVSAVPGANDPAQFELRDGRIAIKTFGRFVPTYQAGFLFPIPPKFFGRQLGVLAAANFAPDDSGVLDGVMLGGAIKVTDYIHVGFAASLFRRTGALPPGLEREIAADVRAHPELFPSQWVAPGGERLNRPEYYDGYDLTRLAAKYPNPQLIDRFDGAWHVVAVVPLSFGKK